MNAGDPGRPVRVIVSSTGNSLPSATAPRQERLEAARSNDRFADRRIAQPEAQLIELGGDDGEPVGKMQPVPRVGEEAVGPVR